ncbi:MAG TPA: methyltransferase domain-containing protein [Gaiellaceae bacterium]|nr:methyltransferase domain-containing protein [Gaiellaceae bacterium]
MAQRTAMGYDAPSAYATLIGPRYAPVARALVDAARLRPDDDVLELGAGTGLVTRLAAPRVRSLLATDVAPGMLDLARRGTRRHPHVRFALVDYGKRLPFLDASFDVVLSGLTYVQDSGAAVQELARVLKPRGRVALTMWGAKYHELTLLSDALESVGRPRIQPPSPARPVQRLERAGLRHVERRDFDVTNRFDSVDEYIEYRRGFGKPVGAASAFYERYIAAIRRRAEADADADGRFELGWTLSVISARR